MLQLFPEYIEQIRDQALEAFPNEGVWLITEKGCRFVDNIHDDPQHHFDVDSGDVQDAIFEGLLAIVHSHTNGRHYPSQHDMTTQINTDVPWGILTCDGVGSSRILWWGGKTPEQIEDLNERTFCHGATDCYALVRDYFLLKLGIALPEFPRSWEWWKTDDDLLRQGFEKAGFSVVRDMPRPGDVWLASIGSRDSKLNHCGVLIEDDLTLHQPGSSSPVSTSRRAVTEPIYRYMQTIQVWVRHEDMNK